MRLMISASLVAGLAITAPAAFAQQPKPTSTPFSQLFLVPGQPGYQAPRIVKRSVAPTAVGKPSVRCGTITVAVEPAFDALIRRDAPAKPTPTVRALAAPPCETTK